VGFLYEATIALRKAVQAGIIPDSLLEKLSKVFSKHEHTENSDK